MDRSTPIYLVSESFEEDAYGVLQPTPVKRLVYANVTSVTGAEWFEGGRNGLNPEYRVRMFAPDYQGEEIVEIIVDGDVHILPVVQTGAFYGLVADVKAERTDQMQPCTGAGTGAGDIAGVHRNFRFVENNVNQSKAT